VRRRIYVFPTALVVLAGCSLLTDLGGLSSGGPLADGGSIDADSSATDSGASDAADTSSGDALVEAAGCARYPGAAFCVDFDGTNPLAVPAWTKNDALDPTPAGTITLTSSGPISAPSAARFALAASANNCRYLRLVKKLPGTFGDVASRFAMRAEDPSVLFSLSVTVGPKLSFTALIALGIDKLVNFFVQQNLDGTITEIGGDNVNLDVPWAGQWLDFSVEYKSLPAKSISVTVPGARKLVIPLPDAFSAVDPQVSIGPFCNGTLTRATFDDFAMWVTP
jgi:hypothetical protein